MWTRFFTFHNKQRPYIILKWAESADGFIAPERINTKREPIWITNTYSKQLVHKWRTEEQAILVGTQTVIDDNPKLDARDWYGTNPTRITIDQNNRIPESSTIFSNQSTTIVFRKNATERKNHEQTEIIDFTRDIPSQIIEKLWQHQIQSIIIEGGSQTLQAFINENLWDEARVFVGRKIFKKGIKAPEFNKKPYKTLSIQDDTLHYIKNYD